MSKTIKFLGKSETYNSVVDLSKKNVIKGQTLKERRDAARAMIKNAKTPKIIHDVVTGNFAKISLQDKPLAIREFTGLNRITPKMKSDILKNDTFEFINDDRAVSIHNKSKAFEEEDILSLKYTLTFRIVASLTDGSRKRSTRKIDGIYRGEIGSKKYLRKGFIISFTPVESFRFNPNRITDTNIRNGSFFDNAIPADERYIHDGLIDQIINRLTDEYDFADYLVFESIETKSLYSNEIFDIQSMKLKLDNYDNIKVNLFNEIIEIDNPNNDNCVVALLSNKYKNIDVKKYFGNDVESGISTNEVFEFCKFHNIRMFAYDINGNVIHKHIPSNNVKLEKPLYYIAYNNHIYPLKNKLLNKLVKHEKTEICTQDEVNNKLNELLKNRIIPSKIVSGYVKQNEDSESVHISSFVHNKIMYFSNKDYNDCRKILSLFGIEDKMTPLINRYNIMKVIESLYNIKNTNSFFPQLKDAKLGGFMYHTENMEYNDNELISIDKNKAHAYALSQLLFIQTVDIRTAKVIKNPESKVINPRYLYVAKPKESTQLMPYTFYYDGDHLIFCANEGLEFDIIYEIETESYENPFSQLIDGYFNKTKNHKFEDDSILKDILLIWMGKFEKGCDDIKSCTVINKICNKDEARLTSGLIMPYNNNYSLCLNEVRTTNIYTRKPIAIQLKNMSRRIIYNKMKELGIKNDDIVQIYSDEFTFINKNKKFIFESKADDYRSWKISKYTQKCVGKRYELGDISLEGHNKFMENNQLHEGYAGCGKSYKIINEIIPDLVSRGKSYIVLTPSYSAMKEYQKKGFNCGVIQKYDYHELPIEKYIIIDEIGLCNMKSNDVIYKLALLGRKILAFGDYEQLYPPNEKAHSNEKIYLDYVYSQRRINTRNNRNTFTREYYDKIIKGELNGVEELKKHRTKKPEDADFIICFSNETVQKYNDYIMKRKKIKFGDIGCKVMCKTNDMRDYGIYNNFILTVTGKTDEYVILDNNINVPIKIFNGKKSKDRPNFIPSYARTAYNIQGDSCASFYVCDDDLKKFSSGRCAYTIISRLKEEVQIIEKPKKTLKKSIKPKLEESFKISFEI